MIWAIDAAWIFVAMMCSTGGFLAAGGVGRIPRSGLVASAFVVAAVASIYSPHSLPWEMTPRGIGFVVGTSVAALAAALGPPRTATSLVVLAAMVGALASLGGPSASGAGLVHHVALADLAGACVAVCALGVRHSDIPRGAVAMIRWRATGMFVLITLALLRALAHQRTLFGMPPMMGVWVGVSEVMAAAVAWRVTHRWLSSVHPTRPSTASGRLGLVVAGLVSVLALAMIPLIISAARDATPVWSTGHGS